MIKKCLIIAALFNICGCNMSGGDIKSPHTRRDITKNCVEEDFGEFYKRFYSDSCFQISRIIFPLPGDNTDIVNNIDSVKDQVNDEYIVKDNKYFWQKKGWLFLRTIYGKDDVLVKSIKKDGSVMREQLRAKDYDLVITREFSLRNNKWMLVYYGNECY